MKNSVMIKIIVPLTGFGIIAVIMDFLEQHYRLIVFIHIIAADIFAFTLVVMQYAVSPAMAKMPAGPEKETAVKFLHSRWHPVVDGAIITLSLTGLLILLLRWRIIGATFTLHWKTSFGFVALLCAGLLHFYFRGYKARLKAEGQTERLKKINRITGYMEKTALITGVLAYLAGVSFNHSPF